MLNSTESMKYIKSLLDDIAVYGYKDLTHEETEGETVTVVVDATALSQFEADINSCCDEVFVKELMDVMDEPVYNLIKAKDYSSYLLNDKRLFYAECYYTASFFLEKFALRNESEKFQKSIDFMNSAVQTEKSGKLYSSNQYYATAKSYLNKIDEYSAIKPEYKSQSIRRL